MNISSGASADGLEMVVLLCALAYGLVMVLAYLFWECGMGLLDQSDDLGKSLGCEVGM